MNTRYLILLFFKVFLISIIFTGCSPKITLSQPKIDASSTPNSFANSPEVSRDKGAFRIILMYMQSGDPVKGQNLYLAEMHPLQGSLKDVFVPVLDLNMAPSAESSSKGEVVISLVPPGKYALSILTPVGAHLIVDSENNDEITLNINAGEITDLGIRKVDLDQDLLEPKINQ